MLVPKSAIFVAADDPLDTYLVHHPSSIFGTPVEATVCDPTNPYVLGPHLSPRVSFWTVPRWHWLWTAGGIVAVAALLLFELRLLGGFVRSGEAAPETDDAPDTQVIARGATVFAVEDLSSDRKLVSILTSEGDAEVVAATAGAGGLRLVLVATP